MTFRHVTEAGSGPPLLFLHGWSARADFFSAQHELAGNFRVIVPDLPGHGRDRHPGASLTIADLAAALDRFLIERDLRNVTLVGWSMGAMVAFDHLARNGADRVAALVVVDMSPRIVNDAGWDLGLTSGLDLCGADAAAAAMARDWPRYAARITPTLFAPGLANGPLHAFANDAIAQNDGETLASLWRSLARADHRATVPKISVPSLVIAGAESRLYRPAVTKWLAAQIPGCQRVIIDNAGHTPHLEQPAAFKSALESFLAKNQ